VVFKLGGPMMGVELADLNVPIVKGITGIIALAPDISKSDECISCGRCVDVCPMELLPLYFPVYEANADLDGMRSKAVSDCIECGCCDHICSSRIPIRSAIRYGKKSILEEGK
jgi:electron transport complex protein RnfC